MQAVREFEALNDLLGRVISYASLLYAADTSDPKRQKFYGDMQEKITTISSKLLFFPLELNRLEDDVLEKAMSTSELGHYRPWLEDLRKEKPYQLDDKLEQLFHEKAVTGTGRLEPAVQRDHDLAPLRRRRREAQPGADAQSPARPVTRRSAAPRPRRSSRVFKDNVRLFTLVTNTLAKDKEISDRWRGFADVADSRHLANRVEREVVDALVSAVREAYPRLSHRYYALKAKWLGKKQLAYWDRNAPLPEEPTQSVGWDEAQATVLEGLWRFLAAHGGDRRRVLRQELDRCAGARWEIAGRLLASDGAERASLHLAELPGEAARRDDARARARPRRAPGARQSSGPVDGADAADLGGDGERVRRDADLPRVAAADAGRAASGRRCSPPRSRT